MYSWLGAQDFEYEVVDGTSVTITKYVGTDSEVTIPELIDGLRVTEIGERAFNQLTWLKSVALPTGIAAIGDRAFYSCRSLTNIVLPEGLQSIGEVAMANCEELGDLVLPDGLQSIGPGAFWSCNSLTGITIPASVASIGDRAFASCFRLEGIEVDPANPVYGSLDGVLFNAALTTLIHYPRGRPGETYSIPMTVTNIADRGLDDTLNLISFEVEPGNTAFAVVDGVLFDSGLTTLIRKPHLDPTASYAIPEGTTTVGVSAFYRSGILTSIGIPESVTEIGEFAFSGCRSLKSLVVPGNVERVGTSAFEGCSELTEAVISEGVQILGASVFRNCRVLTNVVVAGTVDHIPEEAFFACRDLQTVALENGTTSIGASAFYSCRSLVDILIPDSLEVIGERAFDTCVDLASLQLPDGVTTIGERAFYSCVGLGSISIPASVLQIGNEAFRNCTALLSIDVDPGNASFSSVEGVLFDKSVQTLIQYPAGNTAEAYSIPLGVLVVGNAAFYGCDYLLSVIIPEGVTAIGDSAFFSCTELVAVTIPKTLTSLGDSAFAVCHELVSLEIPEGLTTIGDGAFSSCWALVGIIVDDGNTSYSSADGVLYDKSQTTLIKYPAERQGVSFVLPRNVTNIVDGALREGDNLIQFEVEEGNQLYSSLDGVLFDLSQTTLIRYPKQKEESAYEIPFGVSNIEPYAFYGCWRLDALTLPESLSRISEYAFYFVPWLRRVELPPTIDYISTSAFGSCSSLERVTIPESVNVIESRAFWACNDLRKAYFEGDAPAVLGFDAFPFNVTLCYLPGSERWEGYYYGYEARPWNPQVAVAGPVFGMDVNGEFGFAITSPDDFGVRVQACDDLSEPVWEDVQTLEITAGQAVFTDPDSNLHPNRAYRLRMPR